MHKITSSDQLQLSKLSRRGFMIGATSVGVTLAFVPAALLASDPAQALSANKFEPTIWYSIAPSGQITVNVTKAEMGQHIGTAFARIVAEELEADWADVQVNHVDTEAKYGAFVTGGSWSVWQNFDLMSRAGAAGRSALIEEGARLLGVAAIDCSTANSQVICRGKSVSYGDIVSKGNLSRTYTDAQLASLPIKAAKDRKLIGSETQALDIPNKTNGAAIYGIDATYEGMVYAKPIVPPTRYGSSVKSVDDSQAKNVKGYQQTLVLNDPSNTVPGWALVIADSFHAAQRAERLIKVEWNAGPTANVSEQDILNRGSELIEGSSGSLVVEDGEVDATFASANSVFTQSYTTSTVLHFQLEPVNAIGLQKDGIWELHTGNQWQSLILPTLAQSLGVPVEQVVMRTHLLGGGFGRRLNGDYGVPALLAAKALGKPVKVVFSREDDSRFDSPRSASVQQVSMAFDESEKIVGMQHHASAGWPTSAMVPGFLGTGTNGEKFDPFSINGAQHWYDVGAHRVRAIKNDLANATFRPGWLRSVGPGWTNWALESFVDEVAHSKGIDPVTLRKLLLTGRGKNAGHAPNSVGGASRMANVLQRAADKAGWGKDLPEGVGMGIATTFGQEREMPTWSACVAQVAVDKASGKVTLQKLTVVIDAGTIVHPDGALAQTEGAALWGASMALHEGTEFVNGQVKDVNLNSYRPMRMADVPKLDIEFVDSELQSVGLGEPATTVVGPAIGNAIFAASGARVRHLPITADAVQKALV
ncbi:MAG: molybdopterin-dependent oxidoreductase [Pseudomonadales bacterium]|jgi:isoquinoline 1-oxidoreductase beta subunit|nr:molybdopterin-dependent oxidoreductase [Pseudomonadales bacterium]